jgi:hypothetical protein
MKIPRAPAVSELTAVGFPLIYRGFLNIGRLIKKF